MLVRSFFILLNQVQESSMMDLMDLVRQIVAFHMKVMSFSCLLFLVRWPPCNKKRVPLN